MSNQPELERLRAEMDASWAEAEAAARVADPERAVRQARAARAARAAAREATADAVKAQDAAEAAWDAAICVTGAIRIEASSTK